MLSGTQKYNRLYIHIPFCSSKCDYCAFYSEVQSDKRTIDRYLHRLTEEFQENAHLCSSLKSIYIGGGTPTYLSSEQLNRLFAEIKKNFQIDSDAEISIEANPDTLSTDKIEIISTFCNRISIGVQTLNKNLRSIIGRKSREYNIAETIERIKKFHINNISCDIIYAIPSQTCQMLVKDLETLLLSEVKHISAYSLTYEENSVLGKNQNYSEKVHSELDAEMWYILEKELKKHGIYRYEISNYTSKKYECRHNLEIWLGDTYLGCGPAAASFDGNVRKMNSASLSKWLMKTSPEIDLISRKERAKEILIMGLRTVKGWNEQTFSERTGFNFADLKSTIEKVEKAGLILHNSESHNIKCTKSGLSCWNDTALMILQN